MKNSVREVRQDIGMSVAELARRSKTSRQTIHAVEDNKRKDISGILMLSISNALRKPVEEIFFNHHVLHEEQLVRKI